MRLVDRFCGRRGKRLGKLDDMEVQRRDLHPDAVMT